MAISFFSPQADIRRGGCKGVRKPQNRTKKFIKTAIPHRMLPKYRNRCWRRHTRGDHSLRPVPATSPGDQVPPCEQLIFGKNLVAGTEFWSPQLVPGTGYGDSKI